MRQHTYIHISVFFFFGKIESACDWVVWHITLCNIQLLDICAIWKCAPLLSISSFLFDISTFYYYDYFIAVSFGLVNSISTHCSASLPFFSLFGLYRVYERALRSCHSALEYCTWCDQMRCLSLRFISTTLLRRCLFFLSFLSLSVPVCVCVLIGDAVTVPRFHMFAV